MKKLILPNGSSAWGAQMGRRNILPDDTDLPIRLRLQKLRWVDGDYDQWGAYWGNSGIYNGRYEYIWCAWDETGKAGNADCVYIFVRAEDREQAKEEIKEFLPNAKFYR